MRIQVFSDIHADVVVPRSIEVSSDVDAVIVAGDTCEGAGEAFARLRQIVPMRTPILMVMGNHEFYRRQHSAELVSARHLAPLYGIHLLENESVVLDGIRFVGATLWTDYAAFGNVNTPGAMRIAAHGLRDHKRISWSKRPWQRFRPAEALLLHSRSRAYLAETFKRDHAGPTVVITHHAPHPNSLHPDHLEDILSAAYVSDLSHLIAAGAPDLWVHGHVHANFDYRIGRTRVVCNPHGYGLENPHFDPSLVIEVTA